MKGRVWILASILLLGNLGLTGDVFDDDNDFLSVLGSGEPGLARVAFADGDDDDDDDDDDRSDDKLVHLKIRYLCALPPDETIEVRDNIDNLIIAPVDLVGGVGGDVFSIDKTDFPNNQFKAKIFLTNTLVPPLETEEIGTSNASILFEGQTFGLCYEIADILTEEGKNYLGFTKSDANKVLTGDGPPAPGLGGIGDLYFDNLDEIISYVKTPDGWGMRDVAGAGGSGSPGPAGPTGPEGMDGGKSVV